MAETTSKTAFITGASSGIGAEFAHQLASRGFNLVLTARRLNLLQQVAESAKSQFGVQVSLQPADLSKLSDIEQLVSIISDLTDLDLLVNNAGFGTMGRFVRLEPAVEQDMLHVHVIAPVMFCRAALPGMLARNHGAIINVSSLSGIIPIRNVVYQSSKSFLVDFSRALQEELRDSLVRVQALCPGFVYTQFHDTPYLTHFSRSSVPRFLWMNPDQVVSASLKGLEHRQVICIPGGINRLAGALARHSLTAGLIKLAVKFTLRRRRTFINT